MGVSLSVLSQSCLVEVTRSSHELGEDGNEHGVFLNGMGLRKRRSERVGG